MLKILAARLLTQGHRTINYPKAAPPALSDRFRGRPLVDSGKCAAGCAACAEGCPTGAISLSEADGKKEARIDLGKCIFCVDCAELCPNKAITHSADYRLAFGARGDMIVSGDQKELKLAAELNKKMKKLYGRSLKLRQVSAGGCNACEADVNVLGTIGWDLGRFGIQMVASPRHADGILVTGPVSGNMELALKKTYDAVPDPKVVIAVGACAVSGGPYIGRDEVRGGAIGTVPVDLFIPGCPPHPLTILDGLLRMIGKVKEKG